MFLHIRKMTVAYSAVIFFVVLDRALKVMAVSGYEAGLIGDIFKFDFAKNYYIAFSLPLSGLWLNTLIFIIILLMICGWVLSRGKGEWLKAVGLFAIIFGASGNLFDRLNYGYVIDYLNLKYFTVFNLSDAMIVVGVVLLLVAAYKKEAIS